MTSADASGSYGDWECFSWSASWIHSTLSVWLFYVKEKIRKKRWKKHIACIAGCMEWVPKFKTFAHSLYMEHRQVCHLHDDHVFWKPHESSWFTTLETWNLQIFCNPSLRIAAECLRSHWFRRERCHFVRRVPEVWLDLEKFGLGLGHVLLFQEDSG